MSNDPRLDAVNNFTPTQHSTPPAYLTSTSPAAASAAFPPNFTVCIIGASEGIGEQIAHAYVRAGVSNLILAARTLQKLEEVRQAILRGNDDEGTKSERKKEGVAVVTVEIAECDISSAESVASLARLVSEKFGRLDVLIPNAAYVGPVTLQMHLGEPEWVQRAFDVNAMGTYHAAHYFVPLLLGSPEGAKCFFAIGSAAGLICRGHIANTGYCVSKLAQLRLVEFLHEQYGKKDVEKEEEDDGLFALAIHPGAVNTRLAKGNTPESFIPYLVDDPGLAGAVCVWLTKQRHDLKWLSGRYVSANWDMHELASKKQEIIDKDLLKMAMVVS